MKFLKQIMISSLAAMMILGLTISPVLAQDIERDVQVETYKGAKDQYQKEISAYKKVRSEYLTARDKYSKFKNSENKKNLEESARDFLEKAVSALSSRLDVFSAWVNSRGSLSDADRQTVLAEISGDIEWLNSRLPEIQNASAQELRNQGKLISDYWKTHRVELKALIGEVLAYRIDFALDKADSFNIRLTDKIIELQNQEIDTSGLEAIQADFIAKLDLAKQKNEAARAKFRAISNLQNVDQLFQEGHQFIQEANDYIKQAFSELKDAIKEIRELL